jgi:hypothetical protein
VFIRVARVVFLLWYRESVSSVICRFETLSEW